MFGISRPEMKCKNKSTTPSSGQAKCCASLSKACRTPQQMLGASGRIDRLGLLRHLDKLTVSRRHLPFLVLDVTISNSFFIHPPFAQRSTSFSVHRLNAKLNSQGNKHHCISPCIFASFNLLRTLLDSSIPRVRYYRRPDHFRRPSQT